MNGCSGRNGAGKEFDLMKRSRMISLLLLVLLLTGCTGTVPPDSGAGTDEPGEVTFFAMDTVMQLTLYGDRALLDDAQQQVGALERRLSVTEADSEICAVNQGESVVLSAETADLLTQALELCRRTDGALDLSIYPVVRAWGFTTGDYSVPGEDTLRDLLSRVDYTKIQFDKATGQIALASGMEIDLGSVAKGYTGDRLIDLFRRGGADSALINLGGNVQALGSKPDGSPWRIAVQDPFGDGYAGVLDVIDQAVITSGGYERYFEEDGQIYWHIIDPKTGCPARSGLVSVTIVGNSGLLCDALSTALFVMGYEDAVDFWRGCEDFEMILIREDGQLALTEGLEGSFVPTDAFSEKTEVIRRD